MASPENGPPHPETWSLARALAFAAEERAKGNDPTSQVNGGWLVPLVVEIELLRDQRDTNLAKEVELVKRIKAESHELRTALGNLTNGYKYPAEVCEIAREALGTAHEQNATPGAAISSEDSVSYSAESSGPRGLQLQQANLEAGIAKLGEIHNSQEGVIVHGPEATALLAALTFEPTGQCMDASYRKDTVCELQKGHDGSHVGHEAYSGITHAWRSNEPLPVACRFDGACQKQNRVSMMCWPCQAKWHRAKADEIEAAARSASSGEDPRTCSQCGPHPNESSAQHAAKRHTFTGELYFKP